MIRPHLKAAGETLIFLRSGVDGFDGSPRAAWISMLIPLFLALAGVILINYIPPLGAKETDSVTLAMVAVLNNLVSLGLFIAVMYGIARLRDKMDGFPRLITASNWAGLIFALLTLPVIFLHLGDAISRQTYEDLSIWILIYGYAVTGFIVWRCLRLPWELAAALAVLRFSSTKAVMIFCFVCLIFHSWIILIFSNPANLYYGAGPS